MSTAAIEYSTVMAVVSLWQAEYTWLNSTMDHQPFLAMLGLRSVSQLYHTIGQLATKHNSILAFNSAVCNGNALQLLKKEQQRWLYVIKVVQQLSHRLLQCLQ